MPDAEGSAQKAADEGGDDGRELTRGGESAIRDDNRAIDIVQKFEADEEFYEWLFVGRVSASTRRVYEWHCRTFFALGYRVVDDEHLARYVKSLHDAGRALKTLKQGVAALVFLAKTNGMAGSPLGPMTRASVQAAGRAKKQAVRGQAKGLGWKDLDRMVQRCSREKTLAGYRDAALLSLMSDSQLRVSEAAAVNVEDLGADAAGSLTIRRSKTDQFGKGDVTWVSKATMRRLKRWLKAAGIAEGAVFRSLHNGVTVNGRLTARSVARIVKKRTQAAGLEGYRGHSLRVGSTQELAARGAGLVEIQNAGRWRSASMPGYYVRGQMVQRGAMARLRG